LEGKALFDTTDHQADIAYAWNILGHLERHAGNLLAAQRAYEQSRDLGQAMGDMRRVSLMHVNIGRVAAMRNHYEEAEEALKQGIALMFEINHNYMIMQALVYYAGLLGMTGRPEKAARLIGASAALQDQQGTVLQPHNLAYIKRVMDTVQDQIGDEAFGLAWDKGHSMPLHDAVQYVLRS
jgi:tetratricopeptide (TPR) repeat protein